MRSESDVRVRAGGLRHVITISQLGPTDPPTNSATGPILVPTVFAVTRAQISPERSVDRISNGQTITQTFIPITIRYLPGVTAGMQVTAPNGSQYVIQGVVNAGERNIVMELECLALGTNS